MIAHVYIHVPHWLLGRTGFKEHSGVTCFLVVGPAEVCFVLSYWVFKTVYNYM